MDSPWTATLNDISRFFDLDPKLGLSPEQVELHSERYGTNGL